jgi:hypothetical protein
VTTDRTFNSEGLLVTFVKHWDVSDFTSTPKFPDGLLPIVPIKDGERVGVSGAAHLPYFWSDEEEWVVRADMDLAQDGVTPRRIRLVLLSTVVLILLMAVIAKYSGKFSFT